MTFRSIFLLGITAMLAMPTSGCRLRRRVVVVHDTYQPPIIVQPATVVPTPTAPQPPAVSAPQAPPATPPDAPPPAPSASHVWVQGYWVWQRGWVWHPGVWVVRPLPRAVWVPGHWTQSPGGGVWIWTPGHWA